MSIKVLDVDPNIKKTCTSVEPIPSCETRRDLRSAHVDVKNVLVKSDVTAESAVIRTGEGKKASAPL